VLLKRCTILTVLAISFGLVASSTMENALAATPAPTPEASVIPELTHPLNTAKFGYDINGKECSSSLAPKTYTLCNYTTPPDIGIIVQINIYLKGIPEGSHVNAVIFANEPYADFPQGGEILTQSLDTLNVTSVSGEWYNFTMNYPASPNTVYWVGYYSDNSTRYFFDANSDHLSVTSQPQDDNSQWLPVGWSYMGRTIMSLYVLYTVADPQPSPTLANTDSNMPQPAQISFQDIFFVLTIMGAESVIVLTDKNRKNNAIGKK